MKFQVLSLLTAIVGLAVWSPLPAAAEMRGADSCADLSWSAMVSGACDIGSALGAGEARQEEATSATVLVALEVPEPETYALMLIGLAAVIGASRMRRRD